MIVRSLTATALGASTLSGVLALGQTVEAEDHTPRNGGSCRGPRISWGLELGPDFEQGLKGAIYLLTDAENGQLIRLT